MEKIGSFIVEASQKGNFDHILDEMQADAELFPEETQAIIRKMAARSSVTPEEHERFNKAKEKWWENKYAFPYSDGLARSELIRTKYALPKELEEAHLFQRELFSAFQNEDEAKISKLRTKYIERYPDQLEGIEAVFGLAQFFDTNAKIQSSKWFGVADKLRKPLFQNVTEYRFLLSDFVRANGADKEFLRMFWAVLETIARKTNNLIEFQKLQRATVSQVATGRIFEELGMNPRLSHPSEDAYNAIDLWTEGAAVQIKGTSNKQIGFLKTDEISFPGVQVTGKEKDRQARTYHINSETFHEAQRFHAKLSRYRELIKKDVQGYFLVVPYNKIDFITGEPAPELVEFVKEQVNTVFKQETDSGQN